jgi:hypothetical protein
LQVSQEMQAAAFTQLVFSLKFGMLRSTFIDR